MIATSRTWRGFGLGLVLTAQAAAAQEAAIVSLAHDGLLTWTNPVPCGTCHLEWASTVDGPWMSSWASLTNLAVTNQVMQVQVPRFYRIRCEPATQLLTNVTTAQALGLLQAQRDNPEFVVLDVRTPSEFSQQHIKGALEVDFLSESFEANAAKLDRRKVYLVYCRSGSRSAQAVLTMQRVGFRMLYNILGGFRDFATTPGAGPWLEP